MGQWHSNGCSIEVGDGAEIGPSGLRILLAASLYRGGGGGGGGGGGLASGGGGLRRLRLYQCEAGDGAAAVLAASLPSPDCMLRTVELSNIMLGDRGTVLLAAALPCCRLEQLNLQDNSIGPEGARALVSQNSPPVFHRTSFIARPGALVGQIPNAARSIRPPRSASRHGLAGCGG